MIELVIAVVILAILTGLLAPVWTSYIRKAREAKYISEAVNVCEAMKLYVLDQGQTLDGFEILFEITNKSLDNKKHVLSPYISGNVSKGALIDAIEIGDEPESFEGIVYSVDGYKISVRVHGEAKIIENSAARNKRKKGK